MISKKKTAVLNSNKTSVLDIVFNYQTSRYRVHPECCARLAEGLPLWVPPELFFELVDGLRGFRKGLVNVMVENLLVFCTGGGRTLTGLPHVDGVLLELYRHVYNYAVIHDQKMEAIF